MAGIFNDSLWDLWNDPIVKILRGGVKLGVKAYTSAESKSANETITTSELAEILSEARSGNSDTKYLLALQYAEKQDFEKADYWLEKSAKQGNINALELQELLQGK